MNNFLINFMSNAAGIGSNAQAPSAQSATQTGQSGILSMLPMLVIIVAFILILYFFSIRPNKKREKALKDKLSKLKKGDRVQTIGGWRGTVSSIKDKVIVLKIDDNAKIEIIREAIADVIVEAKNTDGDEKEVAAQQGRTTQEKQIENKETKNEKN